MVKKILSLSLLAMMFTLKVSGQFAFQNDIKHVEGMAEADYDEGDFKHASKYYKMLTRYAPDNMEYEFKLGMCLMYLGKPELALDHFRKAKDNNYDPKGHWVLRWDDVLNDYISPHVEFMLGRAYHLTNEFDRARRLYVMFEVDFKSRKEKHIEELGILHHFQEQAQNGIDLMAVQGDSLEMRLLESVSTKGDEYAPLTEVANEILVFTQHKTNGDINMYKATVEEVEGGQLRSKALKTDIPDLSDPTAVWMDPKTLSLLVCVENGMERSYQEFRYEQEQWWDLGPFKPLALPGYDINSVHLTLERNAIIFSATGPESYGGSDLYIIERDRMGRWGAPKNMGEKINTPYDESTPFVDPTNRTLYFSSRGHNSIGGFDVFACSFDGDVWGWGTPQSMGLPVNSASDDMGFVRSLDGNKAFLSSGRPRGKGGLDLYEISITERHKGYAMLLGSVLDEETGDPVRSEIFISDNRIGKNSAVVHTDHRNGNFSMMVPTGKTYTMTIRAPGYTDREERVYLPSNQAYYRKEVDIQVKGGIHPGRKALPSVNFAHNKSDLTEESKPELEEIARKIVDSVNYHIEIAGHTEPGGSSATNIALSQARAEAVVEYLETLGIPKKRLKAVGYGSAFPITRGKTQEERSKNRRTELIIHDIRKEGKNWEDFYHRRL